MTRKSSNASYQKWCFKLGKFKRINPQAFKKHWCELKHQLVFRELGIEYVCNVARQVTTDEKNVGGTIVKTYIISEFIGRIEQRIQELLTLILVDDEVADATWARVDVEQFRRFLQQIGHIVCCEEHFVDHIKAECLNFVRTKDEKEQEQIQDRANQLLVLLDEVRNTRQEYISQFIAPVEEVECE